VRKLTGSVVELTFWEYKCCVAAAFDRMAASKSAELNHATTYRRSDKERIKQELYGACGEMAVAKLLNKFWSPAVNTFHKIPDIEPSIEVRTTDKEKGCLIIRDNDSPERDYFLVIAEPPTTMRVIGYISGSDARNDRWVKDPHSYRPAWFVPQEALTEIGKTQLCLS
jgi:hypothetical protein